MIEAQIFNREKIMIMHRRYEAENDPEQILNNLELYVKEEGLNSSGQCTIRARVIEKK